MEDSRLARKAKIVNQLAKDYKSDHQKLKGTLDMNVKRNMTIVYSPGIVLTNERKIYIALCDIMKT